MALLRHAQLWQVRGAVFEGLTRQDTEYFDFNPAGALQERLNSDAAQLGQNMLCLPEDLIVNICIVVSNAVNLWGIDSDLFYVAITPVPFVGAIQYFSIKFLREYHKRSSKMTEAAATSTIEVIKEIRTVREFSKESEEAEKYASNTAYRASMQEYAEAVVELCFVNPIIWGFVCSKLYVTYLGGIAVVGGKMKAGDVQGASMACMMMCFHFQALIDIVPKLLKVLDPAARICELLNSKPKIEIIDDNKLTTPLRGAIEFISVDFAFPTEPSKQILFGLSFKADVGKKVAFVGSTGCGKSTSMKLIERFYLPTGGQVLLDGIDIAKYNVQYLRQQISIVAQESILFSTSIRENLTYGLTDERRKALEAKKDANGVSSLDKLIESACEQANALKFIKEFPREFETHVGEKGFKLSGGQKQRLAIAR